MIIRALLASALVCCSATAVLAQDSVRPTEPRFVSLTAFAGSSGYDLQGVGRAGSSGLRLGVGVTPALVVEPSVMWFSYRGQYGDRIGYTMAEISIQLQRSHGAVRPYIGGGVGYAFVRSGPERSERTIHGEVGFRAQVVRHVSLMTEARLRDLTWFRANETVLDYLWGVSFVR